jgi:predicted nucleic acid-binding protein
MKILFDTNVILDYLLERQPFVEVASELWNANARGQLEGYISAITPINIFYIVRKEVPLETVHAGIAELLSLFRVCPIDLSVLQAALKSQMKDYEDAVQYASAKSIGVEVIVTRDPKGYMGLELPALSPSELLQRLSAQSS